MRLRDTSFATGIGSSAPSSHEIAGLHYPSDTAAGVSLASSLFSILTDESVMPHPPNQPSTFAAAMTAAQVEWA
jgi:hypothetical protein